MFRLHWSDGKLEILEGGKKGLINVFIMQGLELSWFIPVIISYLLLSFAYFTFSISHHMQIG